MAITGPPDGLRLVTLSFIINVEVSGQTWKVQVDLIQRRRREIIGPARKSWDSKG